MPMNLLFCKDCGIAMETNPNRPNSKILKVRMFYDPSIFKIDITIFTFDKQNFHYNEVSLKFF